MRALVDHVPPLVAPPWARGGHRQTLFAVWLPDDAPAFDSRARIEVPLGDGDQLVGFEVAPTQPARESWVITLFHGLTGSVDSGYVRRATQAFTELGHTVLAFNHRGAGEGAGLSRGLYHSGVSADLAAAIEVARARHPSARHLSIGYSLSGNALLLLLGRDSHLAQPDAAIAVNPPVDLVDCIARLSLRRNRLYELNFLRGCRESVRQRVEADLLPAAVLDRATPTLRDFDERITAPLAGFAGADDYYQRCSARPWLASIACPTVVITAQDDPLIGWRCTTEAPRSTSVALHVEERGGHMGYLARDGVLGVRRWLEPALIAAAREVGLPQSG